MDFKFTIGKRIGLGFGVLIFLTGIAFVLTLFTTSSSRKINDEINDVYTPSVMALEELNLTMVRSKMMIYKWAYFQSGNDNPDKVKLRSTIYTQYPALRDKITHLSLKWKKFEQDSVKSLFNKINNLISLYENEVMLPLSTFESYTDPSTIFIQLSVSEDEIDIKYREILEDLEKLISAHQKNAVDKSDEMVNSFNTLRWVVIILGAFLVIGGILTAIFTVRSIVKPIEYLKKVLLKMGKGVLPEHKMPDRKDEIGEMSVALNYLVDGMRSTTEFAREVGSGNFSSYYKPLSDEDSLGHALLKMRVDLEENERVLEQKVVERTEEVVRQKKEIEEKNHILGELYTQVTDSIRYAKRIQEAILPPKRLLDKVLPNSFILYKPKDIVSGDFYWLDQKDGKTLFAAVDCTGHGVPGAFMSIVGYNILKYVVNNANESQPSKILDLLNVGVAETLHQTPEKNAPKDGMDLTLCALDYKTKRLEFAGAFNPLYLIRNGELKEYKTDKHPIGYYQGDEAKPYTNHVIDLLPGDIFYILSDGYCDQFGGPQGKKFMAKNFRNLLMDIHKLPVDQQKARLDANIEQWRGNQEQIDDILIIGVQM